MKTETIMNKGGDLIIKGCNAEETYVILQQQYGDYHAWRTSEFFRMTDKENKAVGYKNWSKFYNFQQTDAFKNWILKTPHTIDVGG